MLQYFALLHILNDGSGISVYSHRVLPVSFNIRKQNCQDIIVRLKNQMNFKSHEHVLRYETHGIANPTRSGCMLECERTVIELI